MKKSLLLFLMLFVLIFNGSILAGERLEIEYPGKDYNLLTEYINLYAFYSINDFNLRLPEDKQKSLSPEMKRELHELASLYTVENEQTEVDTLRGNNELNLNLVASDNREDNNRITLEALPGVILNADYDYSDEEMQIGEIKNLNLEYQMNHKTTLRAAYDLSRSDSERNTAEENTEIKIPFENRLFSDEISNEPRNSLGLTYQTGDNVFISADYMDDQFFTDSFGTVFGLEYRIDEGKIKYTYLVERGERKKVSSGLELDFNNMATINATYSSFDELQAEGISDDPVWDFGLNLDLNELSSISLDYQLMNRDEEFRFDRESLLNDSNITAELKIKF